MYTYEFDRRGYNSSIVRYEGGVPWDEAVTQLKEALKQEEELLAFRLARVKDELSTLEQRHSKPREA